MPWPKGKPRKTAEIALAPVSEPVQRHSVKDLVDLMAAYRAIAIGNRGLFEDCEMDIYRQFHIYHNDTRAVDDVRPTGCSDRVYGEWEARFRRAFGELKAAA